MDIVANSAYIKDGIKYSQKSDKCPSISSLAWKHPVRFVIVAIVCCGNHHVLTYDIEGICDFGMMYIFLSILAMFLTAWPVMYLEMVIAQKFEAHMFNSLGQMYSSLWTFGAIGAVINLICFITTNLQMTSYFVFALTVYTDYRGDDALKNLSETYQKERKVFEIQNPMERGANPPLLMFCYTLPNLQQQVRTEKTLFDNLSLDLDLSKKFWFGEIMNIY